jgi:hypothetical protein
MHSGNPARRPPIWLVPNLLSLDAPAVAVVWQGLLAVQTGLPLRPTGRAVLALTVWMIYIADRLLDVRDPRTAPPTSRHRFYRDHRAIAAALLLAVAVADAVLIAANLRPAVFRAGIGAALLVTGYLAFVHGPGRSLRLPKEVLVAVLFTVGTFVVAWSGARDPLSVLGPYALAFVFLCLANLMSIERWESRELRVPGSCEGPRLSAWLCRSCPVWISILAAVCAWNWAFLWYRAIAISALGMLGLLAIGERVPLDARRVLVDAVMLTPFFYLL